MEKEQQQASLGKPLLIDPRPCVVFHWKRKKSSDDGKHFPPVEMIEGDGGEKGGKRDMSHRVSQCKGRSVREAAHMHPATKDERRRRTDAVGK